MRWWKEQRRGEQNRWMTIATIYLLSFHGGFKGVTEEKNMNVQGILIKNMKRHCGMYVNNPIRCNVYFIQAIFISTFYFLNYILYLYSL